MPEADERFIIVKENTHLYRTKILVNIDQNFSHSFAKFLVIRTKILVIHSDQNFSNHWPKF